MGQRALFIIHQHAGPTEDRIRGQGHGAWQLPFDRWPRNQVWVELVLTQTLPPDAVLAVAEPKTPRYRLVHVAARIMRHARRVIPRQRGSWPWATQLAHAFTRPIDATRRNRCWSLELPHDRSVILGDRPSSSAIDRRAAPTTAGLVSPDLSPDYFAIYGGRQRPRRQAGPGHRPRCRDPPGHPDPEPQVQEQPGPDR